MFRRPKPGDDEDAILRMQEEFLKEKSKNQNLQPAATFVDLRPTPVHSSKRCNSANTERKPSQYAQLKGITAQPEKRVRFDSVPETIVHEVYEKNIEQTPQIENNDCDKVYFPSIVPSVLGNIIEKNVDLLSQKSAQIEDYAMPSKGFPAVAMRDTSIRSGTKSIYYSQKRDKKLGNDESLKMEVDDSLKPETSDHIKPVPSRSVQNLLNLPEQSYIVTALDADDIHKKNIELLSGMTEKDVLQEQQKLLSDLDPALVQFIQAKRKRAASEMTSKEGNQVSTNMETTGKTEVNIPPKTIHESNVLWENDVLSHVNVEKWLNFDSIEKDKLEWTKGIDESKRVNPDEPYEARFDFRGYLMPYTVEYTEKTKSLFHHGDEPHRPGYSLLELIELTRSSILQQRSFALNIIAGILEYYSAGTYKDIINIPITKMFFVIRFALDENKVIVLEPALKAMRNLLYSRIDEACLDALLGLEEGSQQPCLEHDRSEIAEIESKESELKDFHLAEIDLITGAIRTDILQRIHYILNKLRPSFNCVQYCLQIMTRLARDSAICSLNIVENEHLMTTIVQEFVPKTSINFSFEPEIVYNGKPILAALKFLRVLSLQTKEIGNILVKRYQILESISEYISSGVDGTYGLRIQMEAFSILSNLLLFDLGFEVTVALCPILITNLFKHVQGTDINIAASVISATHAAILLQLLNKLFSLDRNVQNYKLQMFPLLSQGIIKWIAQLSSSDCYSCGHLRLLCSALDCSRTVLHTDHITVPGLTDALKVLSASKGFKEIVSQVIPSSNLLSGIENKQLHKAKNLNNLGGSTINTSQKILPTLRFASPMPFLSSLFKLLSSLGDVNLNMAFVNHFWFYLSKLRYEAPSLCENWFTRSETDFVLHLLTVVSNANLTEPQKDVMYAVANRLCYILRADKKVQLGFLFNKIVFNKHWFTAERMMTLVSLSDSELFTKTLGSVDDIKQCYSKVINSRFKVTGPNVALRRWQEPILPRDWIYLPILNLYSSSLDLETQAYAQAIQNSEQIKDSKKNIISCSLEWILFNELCFGDLLNDIDITDRFCRIMCVFLCDNSLFLEPVIKKLLEKCVQTLFKKEKLMVFNFDKDLVGLNNFQDFYTQLIEQFQAVSYGDHTFAACMLAPLAQKHNVKWRKLVWSEYAGSLRPLDCPEDKLCYDINEYLHPAETDRSLIASYSQALCTNLLRPNTISFRIAFHHVNCYKNQK